MWCARNDHRGAMTMRHFARLYFPVLLALVLGAVGGLLADEQGTAVVEPLGPWEFIVIHHSATRTGDAEIFDAAHRARGMINGLAYHFVIDNGSDGKPDGFIETGPRWVKQMHGGHCRQPYNNEHGIGICLVGNFTSDQPTQKQMDSLVTLIHGLQDQFHIADDHVFGHGEVVGEYSECPGRNFPWDELRKRLHGTPP